MSYVCLTCKSVLCLCCSQVLFYTNVFASLMTLCICLINKHISRQEMLLAHQSAVSMLQNHLCLVI